MIYQVEEIVTLSPSRGGWQGVISQVKTVGSKWAYLVHEFDNTDPEVFIWQNMAKLVLEEDIASSQGFTYPNWQVGDDVVIGGLAGTIEAISGTTYSIRVNQQEKHYTKSRLHEVPRWRLLIENYN